MKSVKQLVACAAVMAMTLAFSTPASAGEVVMYSSNQPELLDMVAQNFEKKTGHKVTIVRMGTGEAMKRIDAEKNNPLCDIFVGGDVAVLDNAKANFTPYKSPEAASLPKGFVAEDNTWTATNVHLMVIMVNTKLVNEKDMPKSWADLLDPKWKDKVVIANPQKSGSAYSQVYGLYKLFGWDGLTKLIDNLKILDSSSLVYKGVAEGEFPVSITMEYAAQRYIAGGSDVVKIVYPADGTIFSPEGLALVKGSKNPKEAQLFADYLLSADVENAIFEKYFRRPARPDATKVEGMPALSEIKLMEGLDSLEANRMKKDILNEWKKIVLNK